LAAKYFVMGKWAENIITDIDQKLENVREQDLRFFRIEEFKRNVARVDDFAKSCPDCKRMQSDIDDVVQSIDEAVKTPGRKRRAYDRTISRLSKHIQKEHGFYPPYYFSYVYALIGLIGGAVLGYFLFAIKPELKIEMFSIGIAVGLVSTYILGTGKDKKIRSEKKLM